MNMSSCQNAYRELLLKKDCNDSTRLRHTRCGMTEVASAFTEPVP